LVFAWQTPCSPTKTLSHIMQIAYFDCFSGISGDMTLSALIDAGADFQAIQAAIESLGIGDIRVTYSNTMRKGFRGKLLAIDHPPEHAHRSLRDVHAIIRRGRLTNSAKDLAMRFFERIARAEAKVHGTTIDRVEFHEVGAIDSIVDMVGVAVAWDSLGVARAYSSAIPTGTGQIRIAHGFVNVPAPATAELLVGVPIAPSQVTLELTTPTGAAIITELAVEFGPMPSMQVGRIGYGAGSKELPDRPNLLRILIGNSLQARNTEGDSVLVLECNLDDVSGEHIGFAIERLWKAGALDVFSSPIQMKKNRPGTLLTVLAKPEDRKKMESILFQQTGTLGIRYRKQSRTVLPRAMVDVSSPWGVVAGKVSMLPTGEVDFSPEYDDCSRIAGKHGLRLSDVISEIRECYYISENARELNRVQTSDEVIEAAPPDPTLDDVNAVFRQLASETEESAMTLGTPGVLPMADRSTELDSKRLHPENSNEFYRWDSSPWSLDRSDQERCSQPLPPANAPREYPIRDEWNT
jgi:pyridinium-3,5-bisthiocarboxylic acid mononucleotide nickel chelatase